MQDFRNDKSEKRMGIFIDALYIKSARNSISAKRKTLVCVGMLYNPMKSVKQIVFIACLL